MGKTIWVINYFAGTPESGWGERHFYFSKYWIKQGYKIIWICTKDGIENAVVKNKSITIKHISSTGIRGKSILKKNSWCFTFV